MATPAAPSHVYRWDLDKTYLKTDFDSLRALVRTAFEGADKKQSVPGASMLLRELRQGGPARVCFISGSPRQMRKVLAEKLRLDGIEFDEFILKPNLRNMLTGRFRAVREQVGYKLPALLAGRAGVPAEIQETCFGDDAESDGFIYSLYGDILAGNVDRQLLERILERAGVYPDQLQRAVSLAETLPHGPGVERIFINLDRMSPTARFDRYGARLVPIFNYFQAALVLHQDGRIAPSSVLKVAYEMIDRFDYSIDSLRNSLQDLLRRGRVDRMSVERLGESLLNEVLPKMPRDTPRLAELERLAERMRQLREVGPATRPAQVAIDYLDALETDLPRKRAK